MFQIPGNWPAISKVSFENSDLVTEAIPIILQTVLLKADNDWI